ncbi:putative solute carrier family 22 member 31 isoform X1 [Xiphias gladius]|uniref:putative solute carrier family 22 member 31 isoform X1 n=1 Tax=Xiphias gladius TaxID=8245 RepID=UPI001A98A4F3|nr:putative solute carrier family 22 member 31 isoform X1 [Xiphias gladius]
MRTRRAMATDASVTANTRLQMDYETKILPHAGGYGRYNRIVVVFSWFPNLAVMLNLFSDVFYSLIPDSYHCKPDPQLLPSTFLLSNFSRQGYLDLAIPWVNGTGLSHCELFKYPPNTSDLSENVPRERVPCTKGWEYAQAAGLQSNFVTEWNLVCSDYWKIPLQHICFMTGWILGYIFLGTLCDWLGRRRGFLLSISLSSLLGVALCFSSSVVVFLLLRLSQGAMLAGVFVSSYIARLELCDPPHRLMVAMVSGFFAVFAELLLPGIAVLCRDWPILQAVATLPLLLLLSYWCCASVFPESPRWLLATAQIPQVKRSLQEFSIRNGVCLRDELYPGETLLSEIDSAFGEDCQPRYYSVLELRQTRVIWKNCLILSFTLFIGTGIQYCFTRNLHSYSTNFYFSYFLRVITGALACIFICVSVNHFGRRGILLLSAIITGLSSLLLLALTQYLRGGLVLVLSVVGLLFSQALAMLSVFFACEVMPTVVRGGCLGLVLAAGCVGMAASSLMELQNNSGYFLHHVIFASFAVLSVLCIMLLPESKRKPLPDSLKEGESQRRPPLFLSRPDRDNLPLLCARPPLSEYNPDNYSRLVSATRRMLTKDNLPYRIAVPTHSPLLSDSETQEQEHEALSEVVS